MKLIKPSQIKKMKRILIGMPELMAERSFLFLFVFLIFSMAFGAVVFYQYSGFFVEEEEKAPEALSFNEEFYNKILGIWETKNNNFSIIDSNVYVNPFLPIYKKWDPVSFLESGHKDLISELSGEELESVLAILNLYEYYTSKGEKLPSVNERAVIWESLGLGKKEDYIGTRYQNQILLNKLKEID